jgi:ADP-ribose pyrophosphatase YjhB (NUDIX family)
MVGNYDIRCSVIVPSQHRVLLVHHTRDGADDWVLPGGNPREGETIAACAQRELREETGVSAYLSQVALVVESTRPGRGPPALDIVFAATEPAMGRERSREPGLEPHFIPTDQLAGMNLHPALGWHLYRFLDGAPHEYAPYISRSWR